MTARYRPSRYALVGVLIGATASLAGCAAGDVQLNGKIFDLVGLNSTEKPAEARVAARAPLVVPPGLQRLPEPGSGSTETASLAEIKDPDGAKNANRAELERQQAEYCKKNYELPKAQGDQSVEGAKGPLGLCRASVFTALKGMVSGEGEDEQQ